MFLHANNPGLNPRLNSKLQDAYLHATLQQIDYLANEDVEMKVSLYKMVYDDLFMLVFRHH